MASRDYYEILSVPRNASDEQIRKAYRDLARKLHPDVNKAPDAAERFNEVQQAYDTLADKDKRARYDRFGSGESEHAARSRSGAPDLDMDDLGSIFETFFGPRSAAPGRTSAGPGRARAQAPRRPKEPMRQELPVSFMTAARGGIADLRVDSDGRERRIAVNIPPATPDGAKLRVRKPEGLDRDLILTIRVGEHPHFRRSAKRAIDLEFDLPVSIVEATLGAKISVPTLDGPLELTLPAGTASGQRLRLRDRGLVGTDGSTGDLLGVVRIVPPEPGSLTDNEKRALEALGRRLPSPRQGEAWREGWRP